MQQSSLYLTLIIVVLAVVILLPITPAYQPLPSRDSGSFLYVGWRILEGELPYRDVWDHKPPAIFYLSALSLWFSGGSTWGIWLVELAVVTAAALLSFNVLKRALGEIPAFVATATWLLMLSLFSEGGNRIETYALLLQFSAIAGFLRLVNEPRSTKLLTLIGVTGALAFLLRQNLIGLWLGVGVFILIQRVASREWSILVRQYTFILIGAIATLATPVLYFAAYGALDDLWEVAFLYNFRYSQESGLLIRLVLLLLNLLRPVSVLSFTGWIFAILHRRQDVPPRLSDQGRMLVQLLVLTLPIEWIMSSLSGRGYLHYYIPWLPMMAISVGLMTISFGAAFQKVVVDKLHSPRTRQLATALPFMTLIAIALGRGIPSLGSTLASPPLQDEVLAYIQQSTTEDDLLLIWGAESGYYVVARRKAPTRFYYQYTLFKSYTSDQMREEFINDLIQTKPVVIIDTSPTNLEVPPISDIPDTMGLEKIEMLVENEYELVGTMGTQRWRVYRYTSDS